jgi:hypothetical protein
MRGYLVKPMGPNTFILHRLIIIIIIIIIIRVYLRANLTAQRSITKLARVYNRSLKVAVRGPDSMAHPLHTYTHTHTHTHSTSTQKYTKIIKRTKYKIWVYIRVNNNNILIILILIPILIQILILMRFKEISREKESVQQIYEEHVRW